MHNPQRKTERRSPSRKNLKEIQPLGPWCSLATEFPTADGSQLPSGDLIENEMKEN